MLRRYKELKAKKGLKRSSPKRKTPLSSTGEITSSRGLASDKGLRTPLLKAQGKRGKRLATRDKEARAFCRERAGGLCEVCGGPGNQTMHAIACDDNEFRWHEANLYYGCQSCHDDQRTPGGLPRFWRLIQVKFPERFAVIGHRARLEVA